MKRRTFLGGIVGGLTALFTRQPAQAIDELPIGWNGEVREFMGKTWIITKKPGLVEKGKSYQFTDTPPIPTVRYHTTTLATARYLKCPHCDFAEKMFARFRDKSMQTMIEQSRIAIHDAFEVRGFVTYRGKCSACGHLCDWVVEDRPIAGLTKVSEFDLAEIHELTDAATGKTRYVWKIPDPLIRKVMDCDLFLHATMPRAMLTAIIDGWRGFAFNDGVVSKITGGISSIGVTSATLTAKFE